MIAPKCKRCPTRLTGAETFKTICDACIRGVNGKSITFEELTKDGSRKNRLIQERGRRCEVPGCGIETWMGKPAPIQLDHIDGNPDNNDRLNLRLICAMCHAQTDTYAGKNVGKFAGTSRQAKFRKHPTQRYRKRNRGVSGTSTPDS